MLQRVLVQFRVRLLVQLLRQVLNLAVVLGQRRTGYRSQERSFQRRRQLVVDPSPFRFPIKLGLRARGGERRSEALAWKVGVGRRVRGGEEEGATFDAELLAGRFEPPTDLVLAALLFVVSDLLRFGASVLSMSGSHRSALKFFDEVQELRGLTSNQSWSTSRWT